jgi:hypothetical protein
MRYENQIYRSDEVRGRLRLVVEELFNGRVTDLNEAIGGDLAFLRKVYRSLDGPPKGTKRIEPALLDRLVERIQVNREWLLKGEGEMLSVPKNRITGDTSALMHIYGGDAMSPDIVRGTAVRCRPVRRFEEPGPYLVSFSSEDETRRTIVLLEELSPGTRYRISYINPSYRGMEVYRNGSGWKNEQGDVIGFEIEAVCEEWIQRQILTRIV